MLINVSGVSEKCACYRKSLTMAKGTLYNCGFFCFCSDQCPLRNAQGPQKIAVIIRKTPLKGWGLFAGEAIKKGAFIVEYCGKVFFMNLCKFLR